MMSPGHSILEPRSHVITHTHTHTRTRTRGGCFLVTDEAVAVTKKHAHGSLHSQKAILSLDELW